MKTLLSLIAATSLALGSAAFAAGPNSYQVTGVVTAVTDTVITVQKGGKENFEIARTADSKVTGELKVGAKVTVSYTMTAATVDVKADKPAKADKADKAAKPAASPAASPAK